MAHYYRHKTTHSTDIPYSFQCEHCLKDSGPMIATISGNEAEYKSPHRELSKTQNETMHRDAYKFLVHQVYKAYTNATEKQIFSSAFKDICPHCKNPQSWAIAGLKKDLLADPLVIVIIGLIIAIGSYFFAIPSILLSVSISVVCVLGALLVFLYKTMQLHAKVKKASAHWQKNLPSIDWSAAGELISEKAEKQEPQGRAFK